MRLERLYIEHFKAIDEATVEIAPLTVLIGPNGEGKSSILHAAALLGETALRNATSPVTRGGYLDLGEDPHALSREAGEWSVRCTWGGELANLGETTLTLGYELPPVGTQPLLSLALQGFGLPDDRTFTLEMDPAQGQADLVFHGGAIYREPQQRTESVRLSALGPWTILLQSRVYDLRAALQGDDENLAGLIIDRVNSLLSQGVLPQLLGSFFYVPGSRDIPFSTFPLTQSPSRIYSSQDLIGRLAFDRALRLRVAERCEKVLGFRIDIDLQQQGPVAQVRLVASFANAGEFSVVNIGAGFVQAIWLATCLEDVVSSVAAQSGPRDNRIIPTVAIEEPELHLHPKIQRQIVGMLVQHARSGYPVILTTQSEHILVACLHAIARDDLAPAEMRVYYVNDGTAGLREVTGSGSIDGGLPGFAEVDEQELQEYVNLLRRT